MYLSFRGYIEIHKLLMPYASEIDARTTRCARIYTSEIIIYMYMYMFFCFKLRLVIFICNVIKGDSMGFMHITPVFRRRNMFDINLQRIIFSYCCVSHLNDAKLPCDFYLYLFLFSF